MSIKKILLDPKTVLVAVVAGFLIGLFAKPIGLAVFPIGSLYIAFLSMCLLPILITAIINGIAGLLRDVNTRPNLQEDGRPLRRRPDHSLRDRNRERAAASAR